MSILNCGFKRTESYNETVPLVGFKVTEFHLIPFMLSHVYWNETTYGTHSYMIFLVAHSVDSTVGRRTVDKTAQIFHKASFVNDWCLCYFEFYKSISITVTLPFDIC